MASLINRMCLSPFQNMINVISSNLLTLRCICPCHMQLWMDKSNRLLGRCRISGYCTRYVGLWNECMFTPCCIQVSITDACHQDKPQGAEAYSIKRLCQDLADLLDHLDIQKVVLIGHDWGAAIAWRFALWHPERLLALIASVSHYPSSNNQNNV